MRRFNAGLYWRFDFDEVLLRNQILKPSVSLIFVLIDEIRSELTSCSNCLMGNRTNAQSYCGMELTLRKPFGQSTTSEYPIQLTEAESNIISSSISKTELSAAPAKPLLATEFCQFLVKSLIPVLLWVFAKR